MAEADCMSEHSALRDQEALRRKLTAAVRSTCPGWLLDQVEDLVQEAMVKLWRGGFLGEGKSPPNSSYLWKVAHSVLVDEIRRRRAKAEIQLEDEVIAQHMPTDAPDPERISAASDAGRVIRECLRALPETYRRAVGLRIFGHRTGEIGRMLGWSYKKAENAVYRGLASLRKCLHQKGIHP